MTGKMPKKTTKAAKKELPRSADGAPVQAYIAAMPGWKSDAGRRLDELIVRTLPEVRKAVDGSDVETAPSPTPAAP